MNSPNNPNRKKTILSMIIAGLITLFLVVMSLALLGGDEALTALGKAIIVVPVLVFIFGVGFLGYYYRALLLARFFSWFSTTS